MRRLAAAAVCATALALAVPLVAQQRPSTLREPQGRPEQGRGTTTLRAALTPADYARAERFMAYNTSPLVLRSGVRPTWLDGDRFWYRVPTDRGAEFVLVDAAAGTRGTCTLPACKEPRGGAPAASPVRTDIPSPDGKRTAFVRDHNLWIRELPGGTETQLTTD